MISNSIHPISLMLELKFPVLCSSTGPVILLRLGSPCAHLQMLTHRLILHHFPLTITATLRCIISLLRLLIPGCLLTDPRTSSQILARRLSHLYDQKCPQNPQDYGCASMHVTWVLPPLHFATYDICAKAFSYTMYG